MSIHVNTWNRSSSRSERARRDWEPVPHINQLEPRGAKKDYANGPYNCAPAVVAMVARGWGRMDGLSDARLIEELSKGLVTAEGTTPEGVIRMLERVDVNPGGKAMGSTYDDGAVKRQLRRGHMLIAQVKSPDPHAPEGSAHYVLVRKALRNGNYLVSDPLAKKPYEVTPDQLREAIRQAPPDGGMLLPVSRPGGSKERVGPPAETFEPGTDIKASATPSSANPRPFTVSGDVFEGVDTRFRRPEGRLIAEMRRNDALNDYSSWEYSYSKHPYNPTRDGKTQSITPSGESAHDFARYLQRLKRHGSPRADWLLSQLEASSSHKDQLVLKLLRAWDWEDPGIGKKTNVSFE
jgi:hypothetical protein